MWSWVNPYLMRGSATDFLGEAKKKKKNHATKNMTTCQKPGHFSLEIEVPGKIKNKENRDK